MRKLFIIGSGFTKGLVDNAPLNNDLLGVISSNGDGAAREIQARYGDDIEVALTRLDLDISENRDIAHLLDLRRKIEQAISAFFITYRFGAQISCLAAKPWVRSFISSAFSPGDVVVSLNYDCLFEGLADDNGLWSPNGGYGDSMQSVPTEDGKSAITVLKPHGSENFRREPALGHDEINCFEFEIDESLFPRSGKGRHFCTTRRSNKPGIIAPSYVKVYPSILISIYLNALGLADSANRLILIGCSVRKEDQLLHTLIWRFIQGLVRDTERRIIILDPGAKEICGRLNSIFEYPIYSAVYPVEKSLENGWNELVALLKE